MKEPGTIGGIQETIVSEVHVRDGFEVTDETPLLSNELGRPPSRASTTISRLRHSTVFLVGIVMAIAVLIDIGSYMSLAPIQRILESIICEHYWMEHDPSLIGPGGDVAEEHCKLAPIHKDLAKLRGCMDVAEAIPGLLLTIPYGILADRVGRKPVALMAFAGILCYAIWLTVIPYFHHFFPVYLVLLGPAFEILGGGSAVAAASIITMIADAVPVEERANAFYRVSAAILVATLIAWPLAAVIMEFSPYLAMLVALGFLLLGSILVLFLPETLKREPPNIEPLTVHEDVDAQIPKLSPKQRLQGQCSKLFHEMRSLFDNPAVAFVVPIFLFTSFAITATSFLLQFVSEKFKWSFTKASILPEIQASVNIALLLLLLPLLSTFLTSTLHFSAHRKDILITRICIVFSALGLLLIGLSPNIPFLVVAIIVNSLGGGFTPTVRSLVTTLIRPDQNARFFALASTLNQVGIMVGGPLLAGVYGWGLERGGAWVGAPFFVAGLSFAIFTAPIWWLGRLEKQGHEEDRAEERARTEGVLEEDGIDSPR